MGIANIDLSFWIVIAPVVELTTLTLIHLEWASTATKNTFLELVQHSQCAFLTKAGVAIPMPASVVGISDSVGTVGNSLLWIQCLHPCQATKHNF